MSEVDTSSYSQSQNPNSVINNAMALLRTKQQIKNSQQNNSQGVAMPTAPTQDSSSSYGTGTDMSLLGADKPYGATQ